MCVFSMVNDHYIKYLDYKLLIALLMLYWFFFNTFKAFQISLKCNQNVKRRFFAKKIWKTHLSDNFCVAYFHFPYQKIQITGKKKNHQHKWY